MMLFKLSLRNMRKSIKDYMIYFLTLVFGVAVFYVFNSLDSQQAMLDLSKDTRTIVQLIVEMVGYVSIFVSFILGFLVIFANNFLIKRRKKEFGVYMSLGMGKSNISFIILLETILIGIFSLIIGLIVGVFASQLTSILVAKMFNADMSQYQFIFSTSATMKTVLYFGIIFLVVMVFNIISVGRYQLIDLLTAQKKNESIKTKSLGISFILFIISVSMLGYAYYQVNSVFNGSQLSLLGQMICVGGVGTFLFFYSLSGFILRVAQSSKKHYLKGLNCFVLRQMNSTINTTVVSISIICLLQFFTICILSTAFSVNNTLSKELTELTPMDVSVLAYSNEEKSIDVMAELQNIGVKEEDFSLKEITNIYTSDITWEKTLGSVYEEAKVKYQYTNYQALEGFIGVSQYNKLAQLMGSEQITLADNQYAIVADFDNMMEFRNIALQRGNTITIDDNILVPKYDHCVKGNLNNNISRMNSGVFVVSDQYVENMKFSSIILNANYAGDKSQTRSLDKLLSEVEIPQVTVLTRTMLLESTTGMTSLFIFIGLYLGIIFLISGAAILALKQLSESSDNIERYRILRKIGASDTMINHSLFAQTAIFFGMPLALACVHSAFGINVANKILAIFNQADMLLPIMTTAGVITLIYGTYFLMTYLGSCSIIKSEINQ